LTEKERKKAKRGRERSRNRLSSTVKNRVSFMFHAGEMQMLRLQLCTTMHTQHLHGIGPSLGCARRGGALWQKRA